jgi:hypothetical protein
MQNVPVTVMDKLSAHTSFLSAGAGGVYNPEQYHLEWPQPGY